MRVGRACQPSDLAARLHFRLNADMGRLAIPPLVLIASESAGADSPYATSQPGIFAVRDVRSGSVKRAASAVGEGLVVISKVWSYMNG